MNRALVGCFSHGIRARLEWTGDYANSFECPEEIREMIRAGQIRLHRIRNSRTGFIGYKILETDPAKAALIAVTLAETSKQIQWLRGFFKYVDPVSHRIFDLSGLTDYVAP